VIVLDASAVLEILLYTPVGVALQGRIIARGESLHAPHLLDVEVAQVLRRYVRVQAITEQRARGALADLADLRLRRYPHSPLLPRAWELRDNLTAYDAIYVALAEAVAAPLVTRDRRLASSAGHRAEVQVV